MYTTHHDTKCRVHFSSLESTLCKYIREAESVWVCVAWISSDAILTAIEDLEDVKLIVTYQTKLVRGSLDYSPELCSRLRRLGSVYMYQDKENIMHNKYIIFRKEVLPLSQGISNPLHIARQGQAEPQVEPYAVWTGSYNFTISAANNIENAVYIEDRMIAREYSQNFETILSKSILWKPD